MDEMNLHVLEKLHRLSVNNKDGWIPGLNLGVRGEKFQSICDFLCDNGYVIKLKKNGQTYISCYVTQKLRDYFKEEKQ